MRGISISRTIRIVRMDKPIFLNRIFPKSRSTTIRFWKFSVCKRFLLILFILKNSNKDKNIPKTPKCPSALTALTVSNSTLTTLSLLSVNLILKTLSLLFVK